MIDESAHTEQPRGLLSLIAARLDGMRRRAQEDERMLLEVRMPEQSLDRSTIERLIEVYEEQQNDLDLFEEQVRRWDLRAQADGEAWEIAPVLRQIGGARGEIASVLGLAAEHIGNR